MKITFIIVASFILLGGYLGIIWLTLFRKLPSRISRKGWATPVCVKRTWGINFQGGISWLWGKIEIFSDKIVFQKIGIPTKPFSEAVIPFSAITRIQSGFGLLTIEHTAKPYPNALIMGTKKQKDALVSILKGYLPAKIFISRQ